MLLFVFGRRENATSVVPIKQSVESIVGRKPGYFGKKEKISVIQCWTVRRWNVAPQFLKNITSKPRDLLKKWVKSDILACFILQVILFLLPFSLLKSGTFVEFSRKLWFYCCIVICFRSWFKVIFWSRDLRGQYIFHDTWCHMALVSHGRKIAITENVLSLQRGWHWDIGEYLLRKELYLDNSCWLDFVWKRISFLTNVKSHIEKHRFNAIYYQNQLIQLWLSLFMCI